MKYSEHRGSRCGLRPMDNRPSIGPESKDRAMSVEAYMILSEAKSIIESRKPLLPPGEITIEHIIGS